MQGYIDFIYKNIPIYLSYNKSVAQAFFDFTTYEFLGKELKPPRIVE